MMNLLKAAVAVCALIVMGYCYVQSDNLYLYEPCRIIEKIPPYNEVQGSGASRVNKTIYEMRVMWLKDGAEETMDADGKDYVTHSEGETLSASRCQDKKLRDEYDTTLGVALGVFLICVIWFFAFLI